MKVIPLLLLAISAVMGTTLSHGAEKGKLIWSDEFDYTGLPDPARWTNEVGFIRNNEAQYYTAGRRENARVENGSLIIEARKEEFKNPEFRPGARGRRGREFADYTSASLTTKGLFSWTYGRIEVRAKLPRGRGVWPAIWTLGTNVNSVGWPACGELDIMEYVGFDPNAIHANIHAGKGAHRTDKGDHIQIEKPYDSFHVYAMDWHPEGLEFSVDGKTYLTYKKPEGADNGTWPFDKPVFLILNLAIGGEWGAQKGIDPLIFPQRYEIDYVRIYGSL